MSGELLGGVRQPPVELGAELLSLCVEYAKHSIEKPLEISELSKVVGYKTNTKISCILQNNSQRRSWTQVSQ